MRRELRLGFGGRQRDLSPPRFLWFHVVRVREAEFLGGSPLPRGEVGGRDTFHAVDLNVERFTAGQGVLDSSGRGVLWQERRGGEEGMGGGRVSARGEVGRSKDRRPGSLVGAHLVNLIQVDCETACRVEPSRALRAAEVLCLLVAQQDALVLKVAVAVLRGEGGSHVQHGCETVEGDRERGTDPTPSEIGDPAQREREREETSVCAFAQVGHEQRGGCHFFDFDFFLFLAMVIVSGSVRRASEKVSVGQPPRQRVRWRSGLARDLRA